MFDASGFGELPDLPPDTFDDDELYDPVPEDAVVGEQPTSRYVGEKDDRVVDHPGTRDHGSRSRYRAPRRRAAVQPEHSTTEPDWTQESNRSYVDVPDRRRPVRQRRPRHIEHVAEDMVQSEAMSFPTDAVTSIAPAMPHTRRRLRSPRAHSAWIWRPLVLPQPRQMLDQLFPDALMALAAGGVAAVAHVSPFGIPIWVPLLFSTMLAILFFADGQRSPNWKRTAIVNLFTVGAYFPWVVMRQSLMRVPFIQYGNGTLPMPLLSTFGIVVLMAALALGVAYLSHEDPEYSGLMFLPAAMLVPFFAGATEIVSLRLAMLIVAGVFLVCAVLTVLTSMLPGAFPILVAPVALAIEFVVLPISAQSSIFPVGSGVSAKLLFFLVVSSSVGWTVALPSMAVWVREVFRQVHAEWNRSLAT